MSGGTIENKAIPEIALHLQGSSYGKPIPFVRGRARVQPNLMWFGDFTAVPHTNSSGGGKGGPTMKSTTYTYTTAAQLALGGEIEGVGRVWAGKSIYTPTQLNLTIFTGADDQQPWGYLQTKHPEAALNYPGISYAASGAYDLGDSASLPQHTFEVQGLGRFSGTVPDATPLRIITDMLTDPAAGAGFPVERLGDMQAFDDYTVAMGLFMSPVLSDAAPAIDAMQHMAELTGSDWVDSNGQIRLIPLTTVAVAGNGRTYQPDLTPVYRLSDDDYLPQDDGEPVKCKRSLDTDAFNILPLSFSDRDNDYNTNSMSAKIQSNIDQWGERPADQLDAPWICTAATAENAAYLKLGRMLYGRNQYMFSIPASRFLLLECGDTVAINDDNLGLVDELVRVIQIDTSADGQMDITAEEIVIGYGAPMAFGTQSALGYRVNFNSAAAYANDPVIFNAPLSLTNNVPQVWIAAAGADTNWSGCDVWISLDGLTYSSIGVITSPARYGELINAVGEGANELDLDMSLSAGTLQGGDADKNVTLSWLDGELVSYARATLNNDKTYKLEGVLRARQRTLPAEHPESSRFVRLDDAVFKYTVPDWFLGSAVFVKFTSRNEVGGATQALEEVDAYLHTISTANTLPGGVLGLTLLDGFEGTRFRVGWSAQTGVGYHLSLAGKQGAVHQLDTSLNEWTYGVSDASADGGPQRSYLLSVVPVNGVGAGKTSSLVITKPAPPVPSGLVVHSGTLTWNPVSVSDLGGYCAWLGTTASFDPRKGDGQLIYNGQSNQAPLPALTPGLTYYACVACYDQWSAVVADLNVSGTLQFIA